jgi:hypothetical protein
MTLEMEAVALIILIEKGRKRLFLLWKPVGMALNL